VFTLLRNIIASAVALFAVAWFIPGISYGADARVLIAAALVFALFQTIVKPILGFIAAPINFLTLGLVSMFINVGLFYAVSYLVPAFSFSSFEFAGFSVGQFAIPAVSIPEYGTVILGSFIVSLVLVLLILLQGRGAGLGTPFGGGGGEAFKTRRGLEKVVFYLTVFFIFLFALVLISAIVI
jgi:protein translocase SecG subunit